MGIRDVCQVCGKVFYRGEEWGYVIKSRFFAGRIIGSNKRVHLCSYHCMCEFEKKLDDYKNAR